MRLLSQLWRDPGEPRSILWGFFVNTVLASNLVPSRVRTIGYRLAGLDVAVTALVRPGVYFRDRNVSIGAHSTVNLRCIFDNRAAVTIGEYVGVSIGVQFITSTHSMNDPKRRAGLGSAGPISVGGGSWIGAGATILHGIHIGEGTVIGASALVAKDCEPHSLYLGVPARFVRQIPVGIRPASDAVDA